MKRPGQFKPPSVDAEPWAHPFLVEPQIRRFREYSERIWFRARARFAFRRRPLRAAFAVNMAQSMYKWATLAAGHGVQATLYLNPHDESAISRPEWEEFAASHDDVLDGPGFLAENPDIRLRVPTIEAPNEGREFIEAYEKQDQATPDLVRRRERWARWAPRFLQGALDDPALRLIRERAPTLRHAPMRELNGLYPYFAWAEMLSHHDVIYAASNPIPAYLSGKPYCIFSVGGDLQFDAGRDDDYGQAMRDAFAHASMILVSNPHTLGHCRRLGLKNAVYLPYPMDSNRYCPGPGHARAEWIARYGGEVFVLTTARIDSSVKGHTPELMVRLLELARERPEVRFLFLGWGASTGVVVDAARTAGLQDQFILLPAAGKQLLIDYYRSCDIVLDQFVYGYYGATALEASAIGKPVVMRLRTEQYAPLYRGDVAPVRSADSPAQAAEHLRDLIDHPEQREAAGQAARAWLLRTHGEHVTVPLMVALLHRASIRSTHWDRADNPLCDPLTAAEVEYHDRCHRQALAH